jgi:hypothetical protein
MKRKHWIIAALLAVALCAYLGLWIYSVSWFERQIDQVYANAESKGIRFLGPKPGLSNFPFVPEVFYTGGVQIGNAIIAFPEMKLRGYPVPGTALQITFPAGISLDGVANPDIWMLEGLEADIIIPWFVPRSFAYEDLDAWHKAGGKIIVKRYRLTKQSLQAFGSGELALDDDLQPTLRFLSKLTGYDDFIQSGIENGTIETMPGAMAMGMMNSLSKTDEATGEKSVTVEISVVNRTLRAGMIRVIELPRLEWDKRTSPAPRQ